jgi:hypothetical protein
VKRLLNVREAFKYTTWFKRAISKRKEPTHGPRVNVLYRRIKRDRAEPKKRARRKMAQASRRRNRK